MAFGPRKKGRGRRPTAKPRLRRRVPLPVAAVSPWTPADYREREARAQIVYSAPSPRPDSPSGPDAPILESDWTLSAFAARSAPHNGADAAAPAPARQYLPDAPILVSDWSLPAYAAREEIRLAQESTDPIEESDWTLVAYRKRTAAVAAAGDAATAGGTAEKEAPSIRIDFRPARFDRPTTEFPTPARAFWSRSLAYASGLAAVVAIGALFFRSSSPPVPPAPTAANAPRPEALRPPPAPPRPEPAAPPAPPVPETAPPANTPPPSAANSSAVGGAPTPAVASPPAARAPQAPSDPAESAAPAAGKAETKPPQPPATSATPVRPAEGRAPASPARKAHVSEPHQRHARDAAPARRGVAGWFDEVVKSVKRLGRTLTP